MAAFSFFSRRSKSDKIQSLRPTEFRNLIAETPIQLVDVRTLAEYEQHKIDGAQLIDIYDPNFEDIVDTDLDTSIPVGVYCHSGIRSMIAARVLAKKGFTVYNLRGGMLFWR